MRCLRPTIIECSSPLIFYPHEPPIPGTNYKQWNRYIVHWLVLVLDNLKRSVLVSSLSLLINILNIKFIHCHPLSLLTNTASHDFVSNVIPGPLAHFPLSSNLCPFSHPTFLFDRHDQRFMDHIEYSCASVIKYLLGVEVEVASTPYRLVGYTLCIYNMQY